VAQDGRAVAAFLSFSAKRDVMPTYRFKIAMNCRIPCPGPREVATSVSATASDALVAYEIYKTMHKTMFGLKAMAGLPRYLSGNVHITKGGRAIGEDDLKRDYRSAVRNR